MGKRKTGAPELERSCKRFNHLLLALKMEEEVYEPRTTVSLEKLKITTTKKFSLMVDRKECSPNDTLILAQFRLLE